jgi:uncharacterized protein (DUF924 family)
MADTFSDTSTKPTSADATEIERLLLFWFGNHVDTAAVAAGKSALWWKKNAEFDEECRRLFELQVEAAGAGTLNHWSASARGRLALVLLTDQLPRNIHRGSARAFAFDGAAQQYCLEGLDLRADLALRPIERVFFYMPLEHAESLPLQQRSVTLFTQLGQSVPSDQRELFDGYQKYALRHRDIIARFGRFPHRNQQLRRASTADELAFLQTPGSSF